MRAAKIEIPELAKWASVAIAERNKLENNSRFLLGIAGCPGAGKSTFAQQLVDEINKQEGKNSAALVPMDGYHLSNEELDKLGLRALKGIPDTFDGKGFVALIEKLKETTDASVFSPRFDRSIEASIPDGIEVKPDASIVVVEGNYLLLDLKPWNQLKSLFDETWYLHVPMDVILPRLMSRHIVGGKDEAGAKDKVQSTDLPNAQLVELFKHRANRTITLDKN